MFKERLKELRLDKGLRLKDVADAVNLSIRAISNYEQGIREPSLSILKDLCRFFNVSADYLIGLTDELIWARIISFSLSW